MKCPLRTKTTYNYDKSVMIDGKLVLNDTSEEWPECYGADCPFHSSWSAYHCDKLASLEAEE